MNVLEEFAQAIECCDSTTVASMISNGQVDVNAHLPRKHNPPAILLAVDSSSAEIADMLLKAGARIDEIDDIGRTACYRAVEHRHSLMLAVLLSHGPNLLNNHIPLVFSLKMETHDADRISVMLISDGAALDSLDFFPLLTRDLSAQGTPAIRALLNRGFALSDLRDREKNTLLHAAAKHSRDPAVLNMLIKVCGIDIEARNEYQSTCCYTAVTNSNVVALRCFVEAGADVNCVRVDVMPLHMVNDIECAMILLAAGAEMNSGFLKLSEACVVVPQFLHALLAAGANLDMKDCDGCTLREHLEDYFDIADDDVDWSDVEVARRDIAKLRLDFVRQRALQVCIGLQPLGLDALQTCEILVNACGTVAPFVEFHKWWKIATTVKHFIQLKIEN